MAEPKRQIRISSSDIREGMEFSAPVFFDDGKNMFLAEGKAVKPYHIKALTRWAIPFLLTYGRALTDAELQEKKKNTPQPENKVVPVENNSLQAKVDNAEDFDEVEELEDVEELEPLEEL